MAFTRFHDDPARIKKQLQESTDPSRWIMDVPGNGSNPLFFNDPHIRMQHWGGNLRTNAIDIESNLRGIDNKLSRNCKQPKTVRSSEKSCPIYKEEFTAQTRSTHPAWLYKDLTQDHTYLLPLNPQENTCIPFQNNLSTRILEKDYYVCQNYYQPMSSNNLMPGYQFNKSQSLCTKNNECGMII